MLHTLQIGTEWLPDAPGSGIGRMFYGLVRHIPNQGVDVSGLVTGSDDQFNASDPVRPFAPASASLPKRLWKVRSSARRMLQTRDPDLVAGHFALYTAPLLGTLDGRPLVVHFHGPWAQESAAEGDPAWKTRAKTWLERRVYQQADRLIVLSEAFRTVLVNQYEVSADRVRIIPGGVQFDRFDTGATQRKARERLGWPTDRPIVLSVRRLVHRVGLDRLINAIDLVRDEVPEVLLHIAGKGPLREALEKQIKALNLSDHARLLGFVPETDLPTAYRAADLSVAPTRSHEGFGLIVVESLAAGTPVVVTPVGGLPEIVSDLSEDLLLPDGQPTTIAARIRAALTGELALPSTDTCQQYARDRYAWPVIARQVRAVYEEVV